MRVANSTKRSHAELEESGSAFPKNGHRNRPGAPKHHAKRAKVVDDNMSSIKKRARAIERLFARDASNIPADVQKDLERELAAHKQRIAEDRERKHRSQMIGKYHMVRFFERQKATRLAKQLRRKLTQTEDPDEISKLKAHLHIAEVDVDYAIYYPFLERYLSLYAAPAAEAKDDEKPTAVHALDTPRPPMWYEIEKTRGYGKAALEKIQNRRSEQDASPKPSSRPAKAVSAVGKQQPAAGAGPSSARKAIGPDTSAMNRRERRAAMRNDKASGKAADGDDSGSEGGGFFEED
ncbi:hypothetical protein B0T26DRAFT_739982 [Lasiosphaeria miniovina]|uniref:rRNA-processing protein EFG1 n=1 Tax=Lasiosphaeria miniovina TaxID=1954250 RepID=A0AA40E0W3_9PEZI|nr:uncharacterized protein B0T26DRAFT_739982 [Lasiosphaeria miniovina]KAK0722885.1 hypothetical protein B0T26DRAFT_739982 [Lasiosphaeria miniovina]